MQFLLHRPYGILNELDVFLQAVFCVELLINVLDGLCPVNAEAGVKS